MANELKIAKAARSIARELTDLPANAPYPFDVGHVFRGGHKAPCCVIGHVIERAGLTGLVKGRRGSGNGGIMFRHSGYAIADACHVDLLSEDVQDAIRDVVEANDYDHGAQAVASRLYLVADLLEIDAAPTTAAEA